MLPLIHTKFRKRHGIPYAVETLSGRQFRCRHCNRVFYKERQLDSHINEVLRSTDKAKVRVSPSVPELSSTTEVRLLYTYEIKDRLQKQWLKLRKGDVYDGI